MKYKQNFVRDVTFYLKTRHLFNFDGCVAYVDKRGNSVIIYDENGVDGIHAFHVWDSQGKIIPTKHPRLLETLLRTKGSVNLHIKMYKEDRISGIFPKCEFELFVKEINAPDWFSKAVNCY